MTQRICAVTGANGFVGSAVCAHFAAQGWRVIKLVRAPENAGEARRFILGEDIAPDMLADVDLLVHAAYDFSLCSWADICRVNVLGSEKLFDAATRAGVKRQIFISSMAAFEGCRSKYGLAKLIAEEATHARGGIVIRPGVIYSETNGGLAAGIEAVAQKLPVVPMIGSGRYPLYMCHVDDLCGLIATLAEISAPPLTPITAAHGTPVTLRALAESAQRKDRLHVVLPVPWMMLFALLWCLEQIGLRPGFRSDSVISLVHANPSVDFAALAQITTPIRPFQSAGG